MTSHNPYPRERGDGSTRTATAAKRWPSRCRTLPARPTRQGLAGRPMALHRILRIPVNGIIIGYNPPIETKQAAQQSWRNRHLPGSLGLK